MMMSQHPKYSLTSLYVWFLRIFLVVFILASCANNDNAMDATKTIMLRNSSLYITFNAQGDTLAVAGMDGTVSLWETTHRTPSVTVPGVAFAWSPDGQNLATKTKDGYIHIWQRTDGTQIRQFAYPRVVQFLAWSPDGDYLAIGERDGAIHIIRSTDGTAVQTIRAPVHWWHTPVWHPHRTWLSAQAEDGALGLWNATDGHRIRTFIPAMPGRILAVQFSSDGTRVAASADRTIHVWEVATGKLLYTLKGHLDFVTSLAFTPDNTILMSAAGFFTMDGGPTDTEVRTWSMETGQPRASLGTHAGGATSVTMHPDGHLVASAGFDKAIRFWEIP